MAIIIGIDPGLINSAWGIIISEANKLQYLASSTITTSSATPLPERLTKIYNELRIIIKQFTPDECAVEETFVNKNPMSSLKLGHARGVAILAASKDKISIAEYSAKMIKKAIVGTGNADKLQVEAMVKYLLPKANIKSNHESDALATAICHANIIATQRRISI